MPDLYDTTYPGEVAGHVEAGAFLTDSVTTTEGPDIFFDGDDIMQEGHAANPSSAGVHAVNRAIGEAVRDAKERDHRRTPVTESATSWQTGNTVLQDGNAVRILIVSPNRKSVVVSNQSGAGFIYVGRDSGLKAAGPNTCYLGVGLSKTFTHTQEIWVVGVAGQIVDWVEENY